MNFENKAIRINLTDFKTPQMRAFWFSTFSFFICFFAWFGIIPFMPDVIKELGLTTDQKYISIIAAVSGTIFARLIVGKLCDRFGPRLCYSWLLIASAFPLIMTGFVVNYTQFLICRSLIGCIGASFVITQYHTSIMFAPNCVGTANATTAGWGTFGGSFNRIGMTILASIIISIGISEANSWRWCMIIIGIICILVGVSYYLFTQDAPDGNFKKLRIQNKLPPFKNKTSNFKIIIKDYRVWILFYIYAGCFGIELTVYGVMDDYLQSTFFVERSTAGLVIACSGLMNLFARTLGGFLGDKTGIKSGLRGRIIFLAIIMCIEGILLGLFSQITNFPFAFFILIIFNLTIQMAEGATFSVVPFIHKKYLGSIAGLVGAGGNVGAVLAGLLIKFNIDKTIGTKAESLAISNSFLIMSGVILVSALLTPLIKFSSSDENFAKIEIKKALKKMVIT